MLFQKSLDVVHLQPATGSDYIILNNVTKNSTALCYF